MKEVPNATYKCFFGWFLLSSEKEGFSDHGKDVFLGKTGAQMMEEGGWKAHLCDFPLPFI